MKYKILENVNYTNVEIFDIKKNGIQIIENDNKIEIYNDPFRTVPLFISKNKNEELIIFSNFEDFYKFENVDKTIDEAGFWEIVLFGSGLWTRTLYKNVKQMPAASKIIIEINTNKYKIEKYWDFNIKVDESIDSMEKAAQGLYDRLDGIFSKLDKNQKYVMGMSGGMDSRITLAFLSKYIPKENLELFTYGFDERLLEYKYACEVVVFLGYNKPKFHKLTKDSYKKAMDYLPQISGGQIGINHCHIIDFLQEYTQNNILISTSYSEVAFSLLVDCNKNEVESTLEKSINGMLNIRQDIIANIKDDLSLTMNSYYQAEQFSSKNEYIYQTERHVKFHEYLSFCISTFSKTKNPFHSLELIQYVMSIPNHLKCKKNLQDYILKNYFDIQIDNISSSRFQWKDAGSKIYDWYNFKFLNRLNAVLRLLTKGHIQLFNKYQTEEQDRLLYRDFHKDLKKTTQKFVNHGLMNEKQKREWDVLPLRSSGISERYNLISLGKLV